VIRINGTPSTVIGVMPEGFRFPSTTDAWQPLALAPGVASQQRDARGLEVFGRLADGTTLQQARAELSTIAAALSARYPDTNQNLQAAVVRFDEQYGTLRDPVPMILMIAVGFVLLISCANVANLLLARSMHRSREISLRAALGASRGRIIRQLLVEAFLLAIIAGLFGLLLAMLGLRFFRAEAVDLSLPYWMTFTFDARVFGFLAFVCLGTSLLFGLAPAWHLSNTNADDVLKDGSRGVTSGRRARRWTSALVAAELALTVILLAGASLLVQSALALYRADRTIDSSNVMTARVSLPAAKYATPDRRRAFYRQLEEQLATIQPVSSAAIASSLPFIGALSRQLFLEGDPAPAREDQPTVQTVAIGSRYFETLGLALLGGRAFADNDAGSGSEAAIVNRRFVELYSSSVGPIGRRIRLSDGSPASANAPWLTIVGVSPSIRQSPMSEARPVVYLPLRAQPIANAVLMFRGRPGMTATASLVRDAVRAIDPDLPVYAVAPLERASQQSRWPARVASFMLSLFASIAMLLAAMGIYAVTAYGVVQRTREIGIRMALGARRSQVSWLMVRGTAVQLLIGLSVGVAGALGAGRLLRGLLVQTSPADPLTLLAIVLMLMAVAVTACLAPARRAARLDPASALRHE
jgi:putative ABC transport system permease protein